ncbi:MAG: hypothetical protein NVS4B5_12090 [Vulcanimicrobiaceae bacterium]
MLSPADMLIIGAVALIAFGPDQLPKVARRAGQVMRDVQNTSQGFIREMERAADDVDMTHGAPSVHDSHPYGRISEPTPAPEPFAHDGPARIDIADDGYANDGSTSNGARTHASPGPSRSHAPDGDGWPVADGAKTGGSPSDELSAVGRRKFSASESA